MLPHYTGDIITWNKLYYVINSFVVDYKSLCIWYSVPFPDLALCIRRLHFFEFLVPFAIKIGRDVPWTMPGPTATATRERVVALRQEGYKQTDIAEVLGISQSAVSKILKRQREAGNVRPRKSPGRPRLTTRRDDRQLLNFSRRNRKLPTSRLRRLWRRYHGINVSRSTVNRRLLQHGYRARRLTKCPRLSVRHRVARLLWAREHRRLHPGHWQHVVFTDESRFILDRKDGRQRVRRLAGENLRDDCIHETTQGGGGSVMIWAGIHYGGKTPLVVPDGNVNAAAYRDILEFHCLPYARRVYGHNFRLQDDNARPHRAAAVREFLEAEGVVQLPWPACSPDMNPIEHAWDALGRAINDREVIPQNLQELADALREEWDAMPVDVINKLLDSMPRRLHALVCARGGHTRY